MNIALVLQHKVLLAMQKWFHPTPVAALPDCASPLFTSARMPQTGTAPYNSTLRTARACTADAPAARSSIPLRVVRVVDAGQTRPRPDRLVISGRMADVCAELDRLAAGEAALH